MGQGLEMKTCMRIPNTRAGTLCQGLVCACSKRVSGEATLARRPRIGVKNSMCLRASCPGGPLIMVRRQLLHNRLLMVGVRDKVADLQGRKNRKPTCPARRRVGRRGKSLRLEERSCGAREGDVFYALS
jgi:hypothetical protein